MQCPPKDPIPSIKTDLLALDIRQDVLVWFGHSSYFMQIDGKRMLVDPVFCGVASPFSFATKAFKHLKDEAQTFSEWWKHID